MSKVIATALATATLALATAAGAGPMVLLEEAAEFERLDARVNSSGSGTMRVAACDNCESLRLKVNAGTALEINGKAQSIKAINDGPLRDGTVFYNAETKRVLRIVATR